MELDPVLCLLFCVWAMLILIFVLFLISSKKFAKQNDSLVTIIDEKVDAFYYYFLLLTFTQGAVFLLMILRVIHITLLKLGVI